MKIIAAILIAFTFCTAHSTRLLAQQVIERQTMSIADAFMTALLANNEVTFKNCIIRADSTTTDPMRETEWRAKMMNLSSRNGLIMLPERIEFDSCTFSPLKISEFDFAKGIIFNSCQIEEYLGFKKCAIRSLGLSKTTIATGVEVEGLVNFELDRCVIESCVFASNRLNSMSIDGTRFSYLLQVFSPFSDPLNECVVERCIVDSSATMQFMGHIRSLALRGDTVHGAVNITATILNMLAIQDCKFNGAVLYDAFNTPERATTLRWEQFANYKITVQDTVNGRNVTEQNDYETILKTYSFFYNIYSKNWQDESQNDCYVEMKTIQTRWMGLRYERQPTFTHWMEWKLNVFLDVFCNYGTEPVKAIEYSGWILFVFALLYFVFPSQSEDLSSIRFTHTFYNLTSHIADRQRQVGKIEADIEALTTSHIAAPPFVKIVGTPFYYGHIFQYRLKRWFIRQSSYVQNLQEEWQSAVGSAKTRLIGIATLYFGALLITAAFIRALNAGALSLNAFVTLGYGEIQAKGVARYLAVVEGALGWFLLSIFSVSLISQILQ